MKKAVALLLALLCVLSLFAGCGKDKAVTAKPTTDKIAGKTDAGDKNDEKPEAKPETDPGKQETEEKPDEPKPADPEPTKPETPAPEQETNDNGIRPIGLTNMQLEFNDWSEDGEQELAYTTAPQIYCDYFDDDHKLMDLLSDMNDEWYENTSEGEESLLEIAQYDYENTDWFYGPYSDELEVSVIRADTRFVSLLLCGYNFSGGAHPNYGYGCVNIDTASGERIPLCDVVTDMFELPKILVEKMESKYCNATGYGENPFYVDLQATFDDYAAENYFTWTLSQDEIHFYFSPYEIGPYAAGAFECAILFDEYPELFNEYYTESPSVYAVKLNSAPYYCETEIDIDGKGNLVPLGIYGEKDENYIYYETIVIECNGNSYVIEDASCFDFDAYFVHMDDDNLYIVLDCYDANSYGHIEVYKLTFSEITQVGVYNNLSIHSSEYVWLNNGVSLFTNPACVALGSQMNVLGSYSGIKSYEFTKDGEFKPLEDSFLTDNDYSLTLTKDIECRKVTEEKPNGEPATLKAGAVILIDSTDNESFVIAYDVTSPTYDCYLIEVTGAPKWEQFINGVNITECFEEVLFAG